jgi:hypothetical protein
LQLVPQPEQVEIGSPSEALHVVYGRDHVYLSRAHVVALLSVVAFVLLSIYVASDQGDYCQVPTAPPVTLRYRGAGPDTPRSRQNFVAGVSGSSTSLL